MIVASTAAYQPVPLISQLTEPPRPFDRMLGEALAEEMKR